MTTCSQLNRFLLGGGCIYQLPVVHLAGLEAERPSLF